MKKIIIESKKYGKHFMLVNDADFLMFSSYSWSLSVYKNTLYAITCLGNHKLIRAHNLILTKKSGFVVDHIDRNGLNNQRDNLRRCKQGQNIMNSGVRTNSKSGVKGVWKNKGKWRSQITVNKKVISVGTFENIKLATIAYNKAAIKYHGEYAYLNKI